MMRFFLIRYWLPLLFSLALLVGLLLPAPTWADLLAAFAAFTTWTVFALRCHWKRRGTTNATSARPRRSTA